jgi:hypothetical protein
MLGNVFVNRGIQVEHERTWSLVIIQSTSVSKLAKMPPSCFGNTRVGLSITIMITTTTTSSHADLMVHCTVPLSGSSCLAQTSHIVRQLLHGVLALLMAISLNPRMSFIQLHPLMAVGLFLQQSY